jgi:hypothetical protein
LELANFNNKVGKPARITDVLENVKRWDDRFQPVKNRYESEFLLFAVPDDVAATADCAGQDAIEPDLRQEAVQQFFSAWFLKQDYDAALSYLSPKSYLCLESSGDSSRKNVDAGQARKVIRGGFENGAQAIGQKTKLENAIAAVQPQHELLKSVSFSPLFGTGV